MNKLLTKTNSNNMYHKILNLAFATVGFAALASCSSDDSLSKKGGTSDDHSYLAITVRSVGEAPATRDFTENDFEDGTSDENKIEKIRFYFFNSDGSPFPLATESGRNYVDKTEFTEEQTPDGEINIEKQVIVDVISNTRSSLPVSVIAVINPDSYDGTDVNDNVLNKNHSSAELRSPEFFTKKYADLSTAVPSNFLMSNSVYVNNGTSSCAALIYGTNIKTTPEEAHANPVNIYVERVAAKVRAKHATEKWITIGKNEAGNYVENGTIDPKPAYPVGNTEGLSGTTADNAQVVYAVIQGWGLADEGRKTPLEKNIGTSTNWTLWSNVTNGLGIDTWTTADYHRSFWELSPAFATLGTTGGYVPLNHTFNDYKNRKFTDDDSSTGIAYTFPNTPNDEDNYTFAAHSQNTVQSGRTKVLVAVQLMKKNSDGTFSIADFCEYKGQKFISEDDVKKAILNENSDIYVEDVSQNSEGARIRRTLKAEDITFDSNPNVKNYQVVAQLSPTARGYKYFASATDETEMSLTTLNTRLRNGGTGTTPAPVNVRHEGMAYYYTPIKHLGRDNTIGSLGVVRNHLYDVTITSITGFGTPVYNPDEEIIPIIPTDEASYLSARINVLAWRVVKYAVDLDATKPTTPATPTTEEGGETPTPAAPEEGE